MIVQTGSFKSLSTVVGSRKTFGMWMQIPGQIHYYNWGDSHGLLGLYFFQCFQWLASVLPRIQNIPRKGISCYDFPNVKKYGRGKHKKESWLKRPFQKNSDNRQLWKMKFHETPFFFQNLHLPKKGKRLLKSRDFIIFSGWFYMKCPTFDPWLETSTWRLD